MKKIVVLGVVALSLGLTACSPSAGDAALRTYTGPVQVIDEDKLKKACTLEVRMMKNGLTGKIQRPGKYSCTEPEGSIFMLVGGKKI